MTSFDNILRFFAKRRLARLHALAIDPRAAQERELKKLVRRARGTEFGGAHNFGRIDGHAAFKAAVPLTDYHGMAKWWDRARQGERNVAWPGVIRYWAISSGTTSGEKFLPVSPNTIRGNKQGGFDAMAAYLARPRAQLFQGKLMFLGGCTKLRRQGSSLIGDNTGIMALHIPGPLRRWHMPGRDIANITDWETRIAAAAEHTRHHDVRLLAGVPSWLVLFAQHLLRSTGKRSLKEIWPNLDLIAHGGMSFEPYRDRLKELVGAEVWTLDSYSASEGGMLAVQVDPGDLGMLPLVDQGVFFEFVPHPEIGAANPTRLALHEVSTGVDYAVVLNTDSGIWGYLVGDVVRFTSVRPYKLVFAGRLAHTLNSFGEHISGGELDRAILGAAKLTGAEVTEYAVATAYPSKDRALGGHVYYVEFGKEPGNLEKFAAELDLILQRGNEDYASHRAKGFGMDAPEIRRVRCGAFYDWLKSRGKLGGQNKVPRVLNAQLEDSLRALAPGTELLSQARA